MFRRILTISGLLLLLALFTGCGSDNGGTNPPPAPKPIRVVVADAASSPSLTSVDDPVWNAITPTQINIAQSIFTAPRQSQLTALSDSVKVQAARTGASPNDSLWIRLQWGDDTHDVWREDYKVSDTAYAYSLADTGVRFSHQDLDFEDQAFILFTGLGQNLRDVWNWRSVTTDPGYLAEGMKLLKIGSGADSLILTSDTMATNLWVAYSNYFSSFLPANVSKDTSEFHDYRLYSEDLRGLDTHFEKTHGWQIDQRVPGYYIDTNLYKHTVSDRSSRWDIRAASRYDSVGHKYTVVMVCPMNTGYDDDINFTAVDSVETQIGLYNNEILIQAGHYTKKFWLIF